MGCPDGKAINDIIWAHQYVLTVVFSNQMDRLASASTDGTAKVWDAQSGEELLTLSDKYCVFRGGIQPGRVAPGNFQT